MPSRRIFLRSAAAAAALPLARLAWARGEPCTILNDASAVMQSAVMQSNADFGGISALALSELPSAVAVASHSGAFLPKVPATISFS